MSTTVVKTDEPPLARADLATLAASAAAARLVARLTGRVRAEQPPVRVAAFNSCI